MKKFEVITRNFREILGKSKCQKILEILENI